MCTCVHVNVSVSSWNKSSSKTRRCASSASNAAVLDATSAPPPCPASPPAPPAERVVLLAPPTPSGEPPPDSPPCTYKCLPSVQDTCSAACDARQKKGSKQGANAVIAYQYERLAESPECSLLTMLQYLRTHTRLI